MTVLQEVSTASELALQLRKLDSNIQWEAMKRPLGDDFPYASADILDRRPAAEQKGWEYLLQVPHGEGIPSGSGSIPNGRPQSAQQSLPQPLQPLTGHLQQPSGAVPAAVGPLQHPLGQASEPQAQSKAGVMPNGHQAAASAEANHGAAVSGPTAQQAVPQQMSVLPNDAIVQQHQQAVPSGADKQITVQLAVSLATSPDLPDQAQHAAQTAHGLPSDMPEQAQQASQPSSPINHAAHLQPAADVVLQAAPSQHADAAAAFGAPQEAPQHAQHTAYVQNPSAGQFDLPLGSAHPLAPTAYPTAVNSMPKQATLLSTLIPTVQQRPVSAGAAPSTAPGHLGLGLPQGYVPSPALSSREGTPAFRAPPVWVHEDALPLWLVKAYEEKRRRDVSMIAARAAQQAQRDANAANRGEQKACKQFTCATVFTRLQTIHLCHCVHTPANAPPMQLALASPATM